MRVVTFITDFGTKDYRAGALKGALLTADASMNFIDISHEITPFDIDEAAFTLRSAYHHFPTGTVHLVNVFTYYEETNRIIFFEFDGHFFIGPDNGVFSLAFQELSVDIFSKDIEPTQHYTQSYADIIGALVAEKPLTEIGVEIDDVNQKLVLQPVISKHEIRGAATYIDRYGNITVNINKETFESVQKGRKFSLYFNRHDHIHTLSDHYMDVEIGTPLCRFNSMGYLELAANLQRADDLLGVKKGDVIQIKFKD